MRHDAGSACQEARYWDRDFETRPWAWVESWQAQQLAAMLAALPQRSELYRGLLAAAGRRVGLMGYWVGRGGLPALDMLEALPFTTLDQLRAAQEAAPAGRPLGLQQAVPQEYLVQIVSAPAPAGRPLLYGLTGRDQETWTDAAAGVLWTAGIRPDDVVAHLGGPPMSAAGWPYADGLRRLGATVAWLGERTPAETLARLPALQVTAVLAPASPGDLAVGLAAPGGVRVRRLGADAAPGPPRETMGDAGVMAAMWSECAAGGGMHFTAGKYVIVELVSPETGARAPWAEGARGEAVYTTFDRDATPVLRYRSGDHVEVTGLGCACGRTSPRVRRAPGRADAPAAGPEREPELAAAELAGEHDRIPNIDDIWLNSR